MKFILDIEKGKKNTESGKLVANFARGRGERSEIGSFPLIETEIENPLQFRPRETSGNMRAGRGRVVIPEQITNFNRIARINTKPHLRFRSCRDRKYDDLLERDKFMAGAQRSFALPFPLFFRKRRRFVSSSDLQPDRSSCSRFAFPRRERLPRDRNGREIYRMVPYEKERETHGLASLSSSDRRRRGTANPPSHDRILGFDMAGDVGRIDSELEFRSTRRNADILIRTCGIRSLGSFGLL